MPPILRRPILLLLAAASPWLFAVPGHAQDARELSVEERARYASSLTEASELIKERKFDAASAKLDAMIAQRPREAQARFLLGVIDAEQGKLDAAATIFLGLIADYPELPEPWNNLAVIHAQKGDYESARQALENALRAAPNWSVAHENMGDVYARLAAVSYDRAARGDADNKTAPRKLLLIRELFAPARPAPR
jgi:TolA-binding protein